MRWRRPRRDKEDIAKNQFPLGVVNHFSGTVTITPYEKPWDIVEIIVHEGIHACLPDLNEEAVHDTARDIRTLLHKTGLKISFDE